MKIELGDREQKQLERAMESNPIRRFLLNRDSVDFSVGDILIKKIQRYDSTVEGNYKWVCEPISSSNPMPQRYAVVHKDEFGIIYMKQLKVSTGQLGRDLYSITDFESSRFEVDPEYAEKIFLDADFDIKDLHKKSLEARKIITKMNRKVGVKFYKLSDSNKFFNGMQPGDKFWVTADFTARWTQEMEIVKVEAVTIHTLESTQNYSWRHFKDRWSKNPAAGIDENFAIKVTAKEGNSTRSREMFGFDFPKDNVFFKQQPAREEKK